MKVSKGVIHPSTKVYAGPFESTIGKMMQDGWSFETSYDYCNYSTRIFGRSMYGVFSSTVLDVYIKSTMDYPFLYFPRETVVQANLLVERIEMPVTQMIPIDVGEAYPSTNHSGIMEVMLYERGRNITTSPEKTDIVVTPEDIPELLQKIQQAQKPKAKELLAKQLARGKLEEYKVQAKILTFS